jgi:hypothetical protein
MENSHIATGRGLQRWAIPTGPAPVRAVPIDIDGRYRSRAHVAPAQTVSNDYTQIATTHARVGKGCRWNQPQGYSIVSYSKIQQDCHVAYTISYYLDETSSLVHNIVLRYPRHHVFINLFHVL